MDDYSYSVIVPNYNKAKYLEKCVRSISNQSLIPKEIIVVDDCSTDDSLAVLHSLQKTISNLVIVQLEENKGVSNARNVGAKRANSLYLKFLDADDFYYGTDNCEKEMLLIKQHKEKGEDILAYSAIVFSDNDGNITGHPDASKKIRFVQGKATYDLLARLRFSSVANNFMVSKEVFFRAGGFSYPKNFYEDYEIIIRLSFFVRFFFSGTYGRTYRWTPDGLSKQPISDHEKALSSIFELYYSKLRATERIKVKVRILFRTLKARVARSNNEN